MHPLLRQHFVRHRLQWLQAGAQSRATAARARNCYSWPHAIIRPSHHSREVQLPVGVVSWQNLTDQHGVYRERVATTERPHAAALGDLLVQAGAARGE